jgi:hypothetical protein
VGFDDTVEVLDDGENFEVAGSAGRNFERTGLMPRRPRRCAFGSPSPSGKTVAPP